MTTALVYFGEHYVIDALAGAALAGLVMVGATRWERWRSPRATPGDAVERKHDLVSAS